MCVELFMRGNPGAYEVYAKNAAGDVVVMPLTDRGVPSWALITDANGGTTTLCSLYQKEAAQIIRGITGWTNTVQHPFIWSKFFVWVS